MPFPLSLSRPHAGIRDGNNMESREGKLPLSAVLALLPLPSWLPRIHSASKTTRNSVWTASSGIRKKRIVNSDVASLTFKDLAFFQPFYLFAFAVVHDDVQWFVAKSWREVSRIDSDGRQSFDFALEFCELNYLQEKSKSFEAIPASSFGMNGKKKWT